MKRTFYVTNLRLLTKTTQLTNMVEVSMVSRQRGPALEVYMEQLQYICSEEDVPLLGAGIEVTW